ncbi:hypothetical protein ACFX1R_010380 [Malus domestica]
MWSTSPELCCLHVRLENSPHVRGCIENESHIDERKDLAFGMSVDALGSTGPREGWPKALRIFKLDGTKVLGGGAIAIGLIVGRVSPWYASEEGQLRWHGCHSPWSTQLLGFAATMETIVVDGKEVKARVVGSSSRPMMNGGEDIVYY